MCILEHQIITAMKYSLNKNFICVYQPNPEMGFNKRRFAVSMNTLHKYIGEHNASQAISRALDSDTDKVTVKLRKCGRIDFYVK